MSVYKLSYFDAKAKGELSRLILSTAGQDFEDDRLTTDRWPELKPNTPYGQVPVLTVDGEQICQSGAIQRYLAREFGLYGKNNTEQTQCDVILETIEQEIQPLMAGYYYASQVDKDDIKKAEIVKTLMETALPKFLKFTDQFLKKNGTGYLVGSELTVADIAFFNILDKVNTNFGDCTAIKDYPDILKLFENIKTVPNVKKWLETRPDMAW